MSLLTYCILIVQVYLQTNSFYTVSSMTKFLALGLSVNENRLFIAQAKILNGLEFRQISRSLFSRRFQSQASN